MNFFEMLDQMSGEWSKGDLEISLDYAQEKEEEGTWVNSIINRIKEMLDKWKEAFVLYLKANLPNEMKDLEEEERRRSQSRFFRFLDLPLIPIMDRQGNNSHSVYVDTFYSQNELSTEDKIYKLIWFKENINSVVEWGIVRTFNSIIREYYFFPQAEIISQEIKKINDNYSSQIKVLLINCSDILITRLVYPRQQENLQKAIEEQPNVLNRLDSIKRYIPEAYLQYLPKITLAKFYIYAAESYGPMNIQDELERIYYHNSRHWRQGLTNLLSSIQSAYDKPKNPFRQIYLMWKQIMKKILPAFGDNR